MGNLAKPENGLAAQKSFVKKKVSTKNVSSKKKRQKKRRFNIGRGSGKVSKMLNASTTLLCYIEAKSIKNRI